MPYRLFSKLFSRKLRSTTHISVSCNSPAPDREGIAVAAIVRNEGRNIAEWIGFHRLAGVRRFFLYDDGCTDDTIPAARAACSPDQLTVIPWAQRLSDDRAGVFINNQVLAYAHFIANHSGRFRWIAMIDVDEFLVPVRDLSLDDALAPLADCPLVMLPWVMFGRNGHSRPPDGGVLQNYTARVHPRAAEGESGIYNTKCLLDPALVKMVHVHRPRVDSGLYAWNDEGRRFVMHSQTGPRQLTASRIQLNHYYTRSDAELQEKIAKGSGFISRQARDTRRLMARVNAIEGDTVEDRTAIGFLERKAAADGRPMRPAT